MSYEQPNYTQIPNKLLDGHMKAMKEAELKVTLAIARKTFGWHKQSDKLSLSQLEELTGLSRQGVINGVDAGIERGTICREQSGQSYTYHLLVNEVDQHWSTKLTSASQRSRPALVNEVDTQKKGKKDKENYIAQGQNDSATLHHSGLRQPKAPKASKTSLSSVKEVLGVEGAKPPHTPSSENPLSPPPETDGAWQAYLGKIAEYEGHIAINFGRERKGINTLVKLGWTAKQIADCFDLLKAEDFWASKHLSAQTIGSQIGAKLSAGKPPKAAREIGMNGMQAWLYKNHGVTDLETASIISGKTEEELQDDYACFA